MSLSPTQARAVNNVGATRHEMDAQLSRFQAACIRGSAVDIATEEERCKAALDLHMRSLAAVATLVRVR